MRGITRSLSSSSSESNSLLIWVHFKTCPCFKLPGRNLPPFSKMGKFLPGRLIPIRYIPNTSEYGEKSYSAA